MGKDYDSGKLHCIAILGKQLRSSDDKPPLTYKRFRQLSDGKEVFIGEFPAPIIDWSNVNKQ